jgi:trans-2,3-dihydro-3-hydroxyanthranilate isomerase
MSREPNHPYVVLDVFTDKPLQGNQLAVFTEGEEVPSRLMQAAAREINFSETVFLLPGDDGADAQLRIFTPGGELPFAGHPTLGAAFVVAEREGLRSVRLRTGAGIVPVHLRHGIDAAAGDGDVPSPEEPMSYGEMEQPIPEIRHFADTYELLRALGLTETVAPVEMYVNGPEHLMVTVASADAVTALTPDMAELARLNPRGGICVHAITAPGTVHARVFCPGLDVPEDPATGSAAGPLVLHLVRHGLCRWALPVTISQGVEIQRPSTLIARVEGSGSAVGADVTIARIIVGGSAVRVAEGRFRLQ